MGGSSCGGKVKLNKSFKIKIKGKSWKVLFVSSLRTPDGQLVMGLCSASERTIYVDDDLKGSARVSTFLHELNHAIMAELHVVLDLSIEEVLVDGLADVYTDLFFISKR